MGLGTMPALEINMLLCVVPNTFCVFELEILLEWSIKIIRQALGFGLQYHAGSFNRVFFIAYWEKFANFSVDM